MSFSSRSNRNSRKVLRLCLFVWRYHKRTLFIRYRYSGDYRKQRFRRRVHELKCLRNAVDTSFVKDKQFDRLKFRLTWQSIVRMRKTMWPTFSDPGNIGRYSKPHAVFRSLARCKILWYFHCRRDGQSKQYFFIFFLTHLRSHASVRRKNTIWVNQNDFLNLLYKIWNSPKNALIYVWTVLKYKLND